ncbi:MULTISPECIES: FAD binding domain-containing protein [Gordonia]|uniref:Xanthine dehydrogenase family protein subunit M n=1 Tax=Gordonia amicalis TaxID=89053 RepID=A0ABU4DGH0_9ACTN|nr:MULTISPECIES: xanthine dehydrogenase family protein subunit M [Gordonia]ATD70338.1 molybdopterin dehydrogenase [Gordonia sp. 1D]MDV6308835.1 xanthine dehydrogenase family protein subunit M [Gordonia amicalis]MDV7102493.1 xanthine dehydrogenase family protein subunit M [Gordonia amicalis]MDV7173430.1 xanthine dehydrogenase family protein subunit M [Gordonia amicalis]NKX76540.1 xanthine dehydrogenase family protein subunit M [Gordonia amicalis]
MIPFTYERADDVAGAVDFLRDHPGAKLLAGGTNLVDHMKLGVANPPALVDISRLPLDQIDENPDGSLRLGATARNADTAAHPLVRRRYPMLARALLSGASPQLRNLATNAGNLLQRTRCVYFQDVTTPCNKRTPGSGCSAIGGYTRYHAVLGAPDTDAQATCVATHPSDLAVALTALDARVVVQGPDGERDFDVRALYRLPGEHPDRDTVLEPHDVIVAIDVPAPTPGSTSTYRKVRDRASYAFALVSVGAEISLNDGTIAEARVAFGGVAHKPWRAERAEAVLRGQQPSRELFAEAADAELAAARPLDGNEFKIPLVRRTLTAVLEELTTR